MKGQIEGHGLGVKWFYTPQAPDVLLPYYREAYQYITVSEEGVAQGKVKDLSNEVQSLKQQLSGYEELKTQIEALKMQMARTVKLYEQTVLQASPTVPQPPMLKA